MLLLGISRLENFVNEHEDSRVPISAWRLEVEEAQWDGPDDVQVQYASAIVQPERVVFSIKNRCKIGVKAKFKHRVLLIEKIWPHTLSNQIRGFAKGTIFRSQA